MEQLTPKEAAALRVIRLVAAGSEDVTYGMIAYKGDADGTQYVGFITSLVKKGYLSRKNGRIKVLDKEMNDA